MYPRGHIDDPLFVRKRLWVFLMVSIDQNNMSFKHNPKIDKREAQISYISGGKDKYIMGSSW